MNDQHLSHDDATALMAGSLPEDRPDLVVLAAAIDDFRDAFTEPAPAPSPELMGWLTGAPAPALHGIEAAPPATRVRARPHARPRRRIRAAASALAGLGVTAKITLGGTAALAAVVGAGAVGVLPEAPQAAFDRILGNDRADAPLPHTPFDETPETDTRPDARSDVGEQRHTEDRSPAQSNTVERQDRGSGDHAQDALSDPPRAERDPAHDSVMSGDSDDSDKERPESPDKESDEGADEGADEPERDGREADDQPDDEGSESDDQPDNDGTESDDQSDDDLGDDGSQADDTEEMDGSSDDAADADGSSSSSDDADDVEAQTGEVSFD